jgi:hypothetical protein
MTALILFALFTVVCGASHELAVRRDPWSPILCYSPLNSGGLPMMHALIPVQITHRNPDPGFAHVHYHEPDRPQQWELGAGFAVKLNFFGVRDGMGFKYIPNDQPLLEWTVRPSSMAIDRSTFTPCAKFNTTSNQMVFNLSSILFNVGESRPIYYEPMALNLSTDLDVPIRVPGLFLCVAVFGSVLTSAVSCLALRGALSWR